MTESARDEALRLAREAGGTESTAYAHRMWLAPAHLERLIALARQRPGWVWVPEELTKHPWDELRVGVAPKPGEGT